MRESLRKVFKAFQYRDFRLMWFGACTSSIGTWMQIVAQGWLIYRLSHSAKLLALDQFLAGIPIFLFSLIGGVVADRAERRKILLGSQYVQMACAALLTVLVATGRVHVWHILSLSFLSGVAQAFGGPAYQALIPTLVDRDDMPNAIALNSIQFNTAVTIGPALAGQALAKLFEKWCFGFNALSFLAPVVSFSIIAARYLPATTTQTMLGSLKSSIYFVSTLVPMDALMVLVGASMMAVFATVTSLVQLITTNEMRGRVMSVYNCAFRGGMPMGNLLSGWLVPIFTAPIVLAVNGGLLVLVASYFLIFQRRV